MFSEHTHRLVGVSAALALSLAGIGSTATAAGSVSPSSGSVDGGTTVTLPVPGWGEDTFNAIGAFADSSYGMGVDGRSYGWGRATNGRLGIGNPTHSRIPRQVQAPAGVTFTQMVGGNWFGGGVTTDGDIYMWGDNNYGQLGQGKVSAGSDVPIKAKTPSGVKFTQIAAHNAGAIALGTDGKIYGWGWNTCGELGRPKAQGSDYNLDIAPVTMPATVDKFTSIEAFGASSAAIDSKGDLYTWGSGSWGLLGYNQEVNCIWTPGRAQIPSEVKIAQVVFGSESALAVTTTGDVWSWGRNTHGQLGNGKKESYTYSAPRKVTTLPSQKIVQVASTKNTSFARTDQGQVYSWGYNYYGELGRAPVTEADQVTPRPVSAPSGVRFSDIKAGGNHVLTLDTANHIYSWGANDYDQAMTREPGKPMHISVPTAFPTPQVTGVLFGENSGTDIKQPLLKTFTVKTPKAAQPGPVDVKVEWSVRNAPQTAVTYPKGFNYTKTPPTPKPPAPKPPTPSTPKVTRVSGDNRYATNLAVVKKTHKAGKPVFVATGTNFPDALSVGPAVAGANGSLLLVSKKGVDPAAMQYLKANKPSKVYIVGGTGAVSSQVETQLRSLAQVERVSGKTRYETSAKIMDRFFKNTKPQVAFVATGTNFPDALTASAAGGALKGPVLLVNGPSGKPAPKALTDQMKGVGISQIYVVGGTGAVKESIATSLLAQGFEVSRLSGPNRYMTNLAVNAVLGDSGIKGVWVATGKNFPDALSAAAPAGTSTQRLALSNGNCLEPVIVNNWIKKPNADVTLVGGKGVLRDPVAKLTPCK